MCECMRSAYICMCISVDVFILAKNYRQLLPLTDGESQEAFEQIRVDSASLLSVAVAADAAPKQ